MEIKYLGWVFWGIIILISPCNGIAGFQPQKTAVTGPWGNSEEAFGIRYEDMRDTLPEIFFVDNDSKIIVRDIMNGRRKIYSQGNLVKVTNCERTQNGEWNEECNILGKFVATDKEGNIATWYDRWDSSTSEFIGEYRVTSISGEVLSVTPERPLKLGKVEKRLYIGGKDITKIQYEDMTYVIPDYVKNYVRDQNDFLYAWYIYTATDPVSKTDSIASKVKKYDQCGKLIGTLTLPTTEYEPVSEEEMEHGAGVNWVVRNEYGSPVIGPDGSVYAWKRTPKTYSILKWEWVDDPNDPQFGPDAPENPDVIPSMDGLYLTWDASPQDPGCVDGYEIERATSMDGLYSSVGTVEPGTSYLHDTGVLPGSTYHYRIKAVADGMSSDYTPVVSGKR